MKWSRTVRARHRLAGDEPHELRPRPRPLSAEVQIYVNAFAADERPAPTRRAASWMAIESALARERQRGVLFGLVVGLAGLIAMGLLL